MLRLACSVYHDYHNDSKFSDNQVLANSVEPDQTTQIRLLIGEQSDLVLHCLTFRLHLLDPLLCSIMILFEF